MKKRFYLFLLIFSALFLSISAAAAEPTEPERPTELPLWEGLAFFAEEHASPHAQLAKPQPWQDGEFRDGVYEGFYAQLDDLQKMLYDKIKEAFSKPLKEASIAFDEPILLEAKNGDTFTEDDLFQWMRDNMYHDRGGRYAVFRDHPELPWLLFVDYDAWPLGEYRYNDQGKCTGFRMTGIYYKNTYPWVPPEAYTNPSALEESADAAAAAIGQARPSRAATVRAIHDYLCELIHFESRIEVVPDKDGGSPHTVCYDQTSYNALVFPNISICNGYSAAFKLLCDRYGIPCVHLSGKSFVNGKEGNHAWNYVQLEDGAWYAADLTWGDTQPISYDHFLAGQNTINSAGVTFADMHETPPYNNYLPACPTLSLTGYPYLEAALDSASDTVPYGEPVEVSLSGIQNLSGTSITNETAGLYAEGSSTPIAVGTIRSGNLALRYDTAGGDLTEGRHTLYIKSTSGPQRGAILAVLEVELEPAFSDGLRHGSITASLTYAIEGETVTLQAYPDAGYQLSAIQVVRADGQLVSLTGSGNVFTFRMPASDVTVKASFSKS